MKINYLILILILPTLIFGQETIQKTKKLSNTNCKEIYNVLQSDKSTLHGSYKKISSKELFIQRVFISLALKTAYGSTMTGMENSLKQVATFQIKKLVYGNLLTKMEIRS